MSAYSIRFKPSIQDDDDDDDDLDGTKSLGTVRRDRLLFERRSVTPPPSTASIVSAPSTSLASASLLETDPLGAITQDLKPTVESHSAASSPVHTSLLSSSVIQWQESGKTPTTLKLSSCSGTSLKSPTNIVSPLTLAPSAPSDNKLADGANEANGGAKNLAPLSEVNGVTDRPSSSLFSGFRDKILASISNESKEFIERKMKKSASVDAPKTLATTMPPRTGSGATVRPVIETELENLKSTEANCLSGVVRSELQTIRNGDLDQGGFTTPTQGTAMEVIEGAGEAVDDDDDDLLDVDCTASALRKLQTAASIAADGLEKKRERSSCKSSTVKGPATLSSVTLSELRSHSGSNDNLSLTDAHRNSGDNALVETDCKFYDPQDDDHKAFDSDACLPRKSKKSYVRKLSRRLFGTRSATRWRYIISCCVVVIALLIMPLPVWLSGAIVGSTLSIVGMMCYQWWMGPPKGRWIGGKSGVAEAIAILPTAIGLPEIKESKHSNTGFKGWMNEAARYSVTDYHINATHSVFVTLESTTLRLQTPKVGVAKRAMWDEVLHTGKFIRQRHYELKGASVFLVPNELCRKRLWSKKYPICIEIPLGLSATSLNSTQPRGQDLKTSLKSGPFKAKMGSIEPQGVGAGSGVGMATRSSDDKLLSEVDSGKMQKSKNICINGGSNDDIHKASQAVNFSGVSRESQGKELEKRHSVAQMEGRTESSGEEEGCVTALYSREVEMQPMGGGGKGKEGERSTAGGRQQFSDQASSHSPVHGDTSTIRLYLFTRSSRDKEEWFRRFGAAAAGTPWPTRLSDVILGPSSKSSGGLASVKVRGHWRSGSMDLTDAAVRPSGFTFKHRRQGSSDSLASTASTDSLPAATTSGADDASPNTDVDYGRLSPDQNIADYIHYMATIMSCLPSSSSSPVTPTSPSTDPSPTHVPSTVQAQGSEHDRRCRSVSPSTASDTRENVPGATTSGAPGSVSGGFQGVSGGNVDQVVPGVCSGDEMTWLNAVIARCFLDFLREKYWTNKIREKIQKKLSKMHVPHFIDKLVVTGIELGHSVPRILKASRPYLDDRGVWVDLDILYSGGFCITMETKCNLMKLKQTKTIDIPDEQAATAHRSAVIDSDEEDSAESTTDEENAEEYSGSEPDDKRAEPMGKKLLRLVDKISQSRYFQQATDYKYIKKAMEEVSNTRLVLNVEMKSLAGTLGVNIPPPPTDRIWYGFRGNPNLVLCAKPQVGEREVSLSHITDWIEKKLAIEFQGPFGCDFVQQLVTNNSLIGVIQWN